MKVQCMESDEDIRSVIYDPSGNAMTNGEIVERINDTECRLQESRVAARWLLGYIANDTEHTRVAIRNWPWLLEARGE